MGVYVIYKGTRILFHRGPILSYHDGVLRYMKYYEIEAADIKKAYIIPGVIWALGIECKMTKLFVENTSIFQKWIYKINYATHGTHLTIPLYGIKREEALKLTEYLN